MTGPGDNGSAPPRPGLPLAQALGRLFDTVADGDLADHRWAALVEAATAIPPASAQPPGTDPARPVLVLDRRLPAAAASGRGRRPEASRESGAYRTTALESDDGRLIVTVAAAGADAAEAALVQLSWRVVRRAPVAEPGDDRAPRTFHLVTPLGATRGGAQARYDLGRIDDADTVEIDAAVPAEVADLAAFAADPPAVLPYGSARRAWQELLARDELPATLASALRSTFDL